MTEDVVVAVIAGGKSRRMGQDKAHLLVDGLPLLARTVFAAQTVAARVLIVGRSPEAGFSGVEFLDDAAPGLGPLGGIATALWHAKGAAAAVLALACDMPRLTPETLQWLLDAAAMEEEADGVAVVNGEQIEPLFRFTGCHACRCWNNASVKADCPQLISSKKADSRAAPHRLPSQRPWRT